AVNKMDLIGFDERCCDEIAAQFLTFAGGLSGASVQAIPVAARFGDNVTARSPRMPWYRGPTLLEYLHSAEISGGSAARPLRFPVQWVNRPSSEFRGYCGTIVTGSIARGEEVLIAGSGRSCHVKEIVTFDGSLERAEAGDAITLTLEGETDIARGD